MSHFGGSGARPVVITADGVVSALPCRLVGVVLDHTAATSAILYDNASAASGTKLFTARITADSVGSWWFGHEGIDALNGIYADWTAGTLTVYIKR